jgi:hypothetical protein
MSKDGLNKQTEADATKLPSNKMGFSQPIEMRFNGFDRRRANRLKPRLIRLTIRQTLAGPRTYNNTNVRTFRRSSSAPAGVNLT